jgi:hypothetical protein
MSTVSVVYATDEDVALRASADFAILCPRDQCVAYGTDGQIGPGGWSLSSPSVNFDAIGVQPGQVIRLTQPVSAFKPPGDMLVVSGVVVGGITLRRKGMPAGVGQPAVLGGGLTGVEFIITTLGPQIATASYDLNRRFGINDRVSGNRPSDLFDPREILDATVLTVLSRQYMELSRSSNDRPDLFATKAQTYRQELDDLLARLVVHWSSTSGSVAPSTSTTRLSARLSR